MLAILTLILPGIVILCALSILYTTLRCGISPMPSSSTVQNSLLTVLKKHKPGTIVYDLGSGWGTLVFPVAASFTGLTVKGIEYSILPYLFSQFRRVLSGHVHIKLIYRDFFHISLIDADTIICYLCTDLMCRLKDKFETELKPGTLIVSHTFAIPGWQPIETLRANDLFHSTLYVYRT